MSPFPSLTETFGQVVLEAMASGMPVAGFDVEGVRDLVRPCTTGWLARAGDTAGFADAVRMLLEQPSRRRAAGIRARAVAERRTWGGVLDALLAGYARVLEDDRATRAA